MNTYFVTVHETRWRDYLVLCKAPSVDEVVSQFTRICSGMDSFEVYSLQPFSLPNAIATDPTVIHLQSAGMLLQPEWSWNPCKLSIDCLLQGLEFRFSRDCAPQSLSQLEATIEKLKTLAYGKEVANGSNGANTSNTK